MNRVSLRRSQTKPRTTLATRLWRARWSFFFIAPAVLSFLVFAIFPMLFGMYLSLTDWKLVGAPPGFIGIANYLEALRDAQFYAALRNTLLFTLMSGLGAAALGLAVALMLERITRGVGFFRTVLYLPVITPIVAVTRIWKFIYDPTETGLLNATLSLVQLGPFRWLGDPASALASLAAMTIWQGFGFDMIIFLAGLKSIPRVYYEVAMIDGANPWQQFRFITLPLLRPVTLFVLVLAGINGLRAFNQMYLLPGPLDSTLTMGLYVFKNAFEYFRMGYAAAIGVLLTAIILTLTVTQFYLFERKGSTSYD